MRKVALKELGSSGKSIELALKKHIAKLSGDIEKIVCKICDLNTVTISVTSSNQHPADLPLLECIENTGQGHLIFGTDKNSINQLLSRHLKVDANNDENIPLTNTHTRFFKRLAMQITGALTGKNELRFIDKELVTPSDISITLEVIHEETELALITLTLDTSFLSNIRLEYKDYPEITSDNVEQALHAIPLTLECEIMRATHPLDQIVNLKAGDFLPMKKAPEANIKIAGIDIYKGVVINEENKLGVKING